MSGAGLWCGRIRLALIAAVAWIPMNVLLESAIFSSAEYDVRPGLAGIILGWWSPRCRWW
jgi:hypothetical protein